MWGTRTNLRPDGWRPEPGQAVDVLALGRSGSAICARTVPGSVRVLVEAGGSSIHPVEGEIFTLAVRTRSLDGALWVLQGSIRSPRFDVAALGLEPLTLTPRPLAALPGDIGRPAFELERVVPRVPGFPLEGAAALAEIEAFWEADDRELAELLAGELLARDLRCLEIHALLGGFFERGPVEERWTERALRHFRTGVAIGELSLNESFEGVLPWRWRGNRGFLRCLYGQARCLERLGEDARAWESYGRLLTLAPEDPMDIRALLETEI